MEECFINCLNNCFKIQIFFKKGIFLNQQLIREVLPELYLTNVIKMLALNFKLIIAKKQQKPQSLLF